MISGAPKVYTPSLLGYLGAEREVVIEGTAVNLPVALVPAVAVHIHSPIPSHVARLPPQVTSQQIRLD